MQQFLYNLQSKTVLGLISLLAIVLFLNWVGRLTPETVDALKWIGGAYLAQRAVATGTENLGGPKA